MTDASLLRRSTRALAVAALGVLAACQQAEQAPVAPIEISRDASCSLDGMLLADYPGPKAQIHYEQGKPDFFCDTVEMFAIYLRPEQQRRVRALYVQDMGRTDWDNPRSSWIDARSAFYVKDSAKRGAMGPTLASFVSEQAAREFAGRHGGRVLRFAEVTPEMVILDGGALHDRRM